jgi:hypothetical protein
VRDQTFVDFIKLTLFSRHQIAVSAILRTWHSQLTSKQSLLLLPPPWASDPAAAAQRFFSADGSPAAAQPSPA